MFGSLNPRSRNVEYRRYYARLCQHQRRNYGLRGLPFLSYEATLLFALCGESGAFDPQALPAVRCCKLRRTRSPDVGDRPAGDLCAAAGLFLAGAKLEDDARDRPGPLIRLARRLWRSPIAQAEAHLRRLDAGAVGRMRGHVADHVRMERGGGPIPLDVYARPTADAFAELFGLAARLPRLADRREFFEACGSEVGAAVLIFDVAIDFGRDRSRGEFNPLPDAGSVTEALAEADAALARLGSTIRAELGRDSVAARAVESVRARRRCRVPLAMAGGGYSLPPTGDAGDAAPLDDGPVGKSQTSSKNCCDGGCEGCCASVQCCEICAVCGACG